MNRKATLSGPIETLCCVNERGRFYRINISHSICLLVTVERGIFVGEKFCVVFTTKIKFDEKIAWYVNT